MITPTTDLRNRLAPVTRTMNESNLAKLRTVRAELSRTEIESADPERIIAALGDSKRAEDQETIAQAHYSLMKRLTFRGEYAAADEYGRQALSRASRSVRYLIEQRRRLLKTREPPAARRTSGTRYVRGFVSLSSIGRVPVLGVYGSRGIRGTLNDAIDLLKKAPVEMEPWEHDRRDALIAEGAEAMWALVGAFDWAENLDAIIPIPPDFERYATRGYSPPDELAKALSDLSCIPFVGDLLVKTRETRDLRGLSPSKRAAALEGSMRVAPAREHVAHAASFLLIDDVVTHGTHFRLSARLLREAGAKDVKAAALATGRDNLIPLGN